MKIVYLQQADLFSYKQSGITIIFLIMSRLCDKSKSIEI